MSGNDSDSHTTRCECFLTFGGLAYFSHKPPKGLFLGGLVEYDTSDQSRELLKDMWNYSIRQMYMYYIIYPHNQSFSFKKTSFKTATIGQ